MKPDIYDLEKEIKTFYSQKYPDTYTRDDSKHYFQYKDEIPFEMESYAGIRVEFENTPSQIRKPRCEDTLDHIKFGNFEGDEGGALDHSGINEVLNFKNCKNLGRFDMYVPPETFDEFYDHYIERYISAILIAPEMKCHKIVVYFHANAEDAGQAVPFCNEINSKLDVSNYLFSVIS